MNEKLSLKVGMFESEWVHAHTHYEFQTKMSVRKLNFNAEYVTNSFYSVIKTGLNWDSFYSVIKQD